jgi:hypothetical protein
MMMSKSQTRRHKDQTSLTYAYLIECDETEVEVGLGMSPSSLFDMNLLRSGIEDGNAVLKEVHDKDVVLVVGKTRT